MFRRISIFIGLMWCLAVGAAEYVGTMRMESGYTRENVRVVWDEQGSITLHNVKFARMMPVRLDVVIPQVRKRTENGQTILSGDKIIPTVNNKPHPKRIVTRLQGKADKHTITFQCLLGGKRLHFEGKIAP